MSDATCPPATNTSTTERSTSTRKSSVSWPSRSSKDPCHGHLASQASVHTPQLALGFTQGVCRLPETWPNRDLLPAIGAEMLILMSVELMVLCWSASTLIPNPLAAVFSGRENETSMSIVSPHCWDSLVPPPEAAAGEDSGSVVSLAIN